MRSGYLPLLVDMRALGVILEVEDTGALLATFHVRPSPSGSYFSRAVIGSTDD